MKETTKFETREMWLISACEALKPLFAGAGAKLPAKLRVTCGWPNRGGTSASKRTIGQCWSVEASADGTTEMFISPYLDKPLHIDGTDGCGVLPTLVHELVHASVGVEHGHKKPFAVLARKLDLQGKLTHTNAGETLLARLETLSAELGPYPHAKLDLTKSPIKKQSARMLKCECDGCGYTIRLAKKWLDVGVPECPACKVPLVPEVKGEVDEGDEG